MLTSQVNKQNYAHFSTEPELVTLAWLSQQRTWYPVIHPKPASGWNHPRETVNGKTLVDQQEFKITSQSTQDALLTLQETHLAMQELSKNNPPKKLFPALLLNHFHSIQVLDLDIPIYMRGHSEAYQAMNAMITRFQGLGENVIIMQSQSGFGLHCIIGRASNDWRETSDMDTDAPKTSLSELGEGVKLERWMNARPIYLTGKIIYGNPLSAISQVSRTKLDAEFPPEIKLTINNLSKLYARDALGRARRVIARADYKGKEYQIIYSAQKVLWYCDPETGIRQNLDIASDSYLHALSIHADEFFSDKLKEETSKELSEEWHESARHSNTVPNARYLRPAIETIIHANEDGDVESKITKLGEYGTQISNTELYSQPARDYYVHVQGTPKDYIYSCATKMPVDKTRVLSTKIAESMSPIPQFATTEILETLRKQHPMECELVDAVFEAWEDRWKVIAWAAIRPRKSLVAVIGTGDRGKSMLFGMLADAGLGFVMDSPKELLGKEKARFSVIDREITRKRIIMIDEASSALHVREDEADPAAMIFSPDILKTLTSGVDKTYEEKNINAKSMPVVGTPVFVANDRLGFPTENKEVLTRSILLSAPKHNEKLKNRALDWYKRASSRVYFMSIFVREMFNHWQEHSIQTPPMTDNMWEEHIRLTIECAKYTAVNSMKKPESGETIQRIAKAEGRVIYLLDQDSRIPTKVKERFELAPPEKKTQSDVEFPVEKPKGNPMNVFDGVDLSQYGIEL